MKKIFLLLVLTGVLLHSSALAQSTDMMTMVQIRVVANDAKLIGSGVGGSPIVVRNAETGTVLAEGIHGGVTGNTDLIIRNPQVRHATLYDTEGTTGFLAEIMLSEPTLVDITASAPQKFPESGVMATKRMWLFPGENILGEGVVLVMNGFNVEWLTDGSSLEAGRETDFRVRVTMLCGCPTTPAGLWDSDDYTVVVNLYAESGLASSHTLTYSGETSVYEVSTILPESGTYRAEILVSDLRRANFGRIERIIELN